MIKIFHTFIDDSVTLFPEEKLRYLPADIQEGIMKYRGFRERLSRLLGKLLLIESLKETADPDAIKTLYYDEMGKPHIKGEVDFSISHSDKCVCCATAISGKVGLDIEKIREIRLLDFKNFLTPEQYLAVNKFGDIKLFFNYWTQNESLLKGDGRGFRLKLGNLKKEQDGAVTIDNTKWYINEVTIQSDYAASVATTLKNPIIKLQEITFSEIIKAS